MVSSLFNKRITELENKIYKTEFDISKYYLSDKEIVKNIIKLKNPSMSKSDIELMVHGPNYKPPIDINYPSKKKETIVKNRYTYNIRNADNSWAAKIFLEGVEIGEMSYDVNYEYKGLKGYEAVQKSLEDDAIQNGFTFNNKSYPKTTTVEKEINIPIQLPKVEENEILGLSASNLFEYSPFPLPQDSQYYQEANRYKEEVKKSATLFMLSKKELANQLVSSLTLLNSSIPGIALMVSAPPWNVPAALSMAALVLDSLNDLIAKSVKTIENLSPLKNLSLLLSGDKLSIVMKILNPVISVLIAILDPIETIKKFILKLIDKIKSLFNSNNCRKQIRRMKRQITKKNIELTKKKAERVAAKIARNTSKFNEIEEDIEDLLDEISELRQQLGELQKRCGKKISLEQDMDDLNTLVDQVNAESDKWIESLNFETVYDVLLPDGTTLNGLTEEQLNNLKQEYTVIFNN
jgi:hypothetical protein